MTFYDPDDGFNAASWFGTIANTMWNDYLDYWEQQNVDDDSELSDSDRHTFKLLMEIAEALRPSLHSLTLDSKAQGAITTFLRDLGNKEDVDTPLAIKLAQVLHAHKIVAHGIQIDLAVEAADTLLKGAEGRYGDLLGLLAERRLSERAAAYLDRATRLFLWGFEPETIVMCAAALEAAYESRFSPLDMLRLQITKKGKKFEVYQYEHAALASGVYTPAQAALAHRLRDARNDVVHAVPAVALTGRQALVFTSELLSSLFPA
jgi:hypothetical protein